jgi:excisionase family DNA binding protein
MGKLTFEELPDAVEKILLAITRIETLLTDDFQTEEPHTLMNIKETSLFLNLSVSTIYTKVCRGEIPALKPGRRLYFDKKALIEWIKSSKRQSNEELAATSKRIYGIANIRSYKRKASRSVNPT